MKLRRLYPTEHNALQIGNHPINAVSHRHELLTFISSSSAEPADICSHGAARGARPVVTGEQRAAAAVRWWCPPARRALSQEGQSSTYSVTQQNEGFGLHLVPLVAVRNTLPSEEAGSAAALLSDVYTSARQPSHHDHLAGCRHVLGDFPCRERRSRPTAVQQTGQSQIDEISLRRNPPPPLGVGTFTGGRTSAALAELGNWFSLCKTRCCVCVCDTHACSCFSVSERVEDITSCDCRTPYANISLLARRPVECLGQDERLLLW